MGRRTGVLLAAVVLAAGVLGACGGGGSDSADSGKGDAATPATDGKAQVVDVIARDYSFAMPATVKAGLVTFNMKNEGQESHFLGIIKPVPGQTLAQVKSALQAQQTPVPPPGPQPYEDVAGVSMADTGLSGNATYKLRPGKYLVFCSIPTADGVPHFAKGMLNDLEVTSGSTGALPKAEATIVGTDMGLSPVPPLSAGKHTIAFKNDGKQLHEVNLVKLLPGKTMTEVVDWFKTRSGPPPTVSLGGVAVQPGETGTTEIELETGVQYAFICAVDDILGDHSPHILQGMFSPAFTAT